MTSMFMRALLGVLLLFVLAGCSRPVSKEEVIGSYVLDNATANFVLVLNADGSYVHTCHTKEGKTTTRTGKWEWDRDDTDNPLCFEDFTEFPGEDIDGSTPSFYILHPQRSGLGIRFPVGDTETPKRYFQRQDSSPH